jgi:hypothetical protein
VAGWEDGGEGSEDGEDLMATASGEVGGDLNKAHSTASRRLGRRHVVAFRGYSETTRYTRHLRRTGQLKTIADTVRRR